MDLTVITDKCHHHPASCCSSFVWERLHKACWQSCSKRSFSRATVNCKQRSAYVTCQLFVNIRSHKSRWLQRPRPLAARPQP